jgi:hypothetical protein
MTKKSEANTRKLMQDVEAYTCGEIPSPLDLLRAATLERWYMTIRRRGKGFVMVVSGEVHKHQEIEDGQAIQSSAVAWFDRKNRFIRTHNRIYALGKPAGDKEGFDE